MSYVPFVLYFLYNSDTSLCMHYDYNEYTLGLLFGSDSEAKNEKPKLILELARFICIFVDSALQLQVG